MPRRAGGRRKRRRGACGIGSAPAGNAPNYASTSGSKRDAGRVPRRETARRRRKGGSGRRERARGKHDEIRMGSGRKRGRCEGAAPRREAAQGRFQGGAEASRAGPFAKPGNEAVGAFAKPGSEGFAKPGGSLGALGEENSA